MSADFEAEQQAQLEAQLNHDLAIWHLVEDWWYATHHLIGIMSSEESYDPHLLATCVGSTLGSNRISVDSNHARGLAQGLTVLSS